MFMDKLILELITLLTEMLLTQQRLLQIATSRQEAMRSFDVERLNTLLEQERGETQRAEGYEQRRNKLVQQFQSLAGKETPASVTEIAKRAGEPMKSQLLGLAGQLKGVVEQLDRHTRINAKISETVVKALAKVLKVMTGLAQHAGLYMRNGRKAAMKGIHLLEVTG
jgi:uncharacterized membrane protein YdfJ with MMPL/SSD domain